MVRAKVSFIEIYNESVIDLLSVHPRLLTVREDALHDRVFVEVCVAEHSFGATPTQNTRERAHTHPPTPSSRINTPRTNTRRGLMRRL